MCYTPITVCPDGINRYTVPCGKCPRCALRRASSWSFRLMQEERVSLSSWFITLTYETWSIPISPNFYKTLCLRDLQLFFKRLRKLHEGHSTYNVPLKYYAVGEYGSQTQRPHYHILLFNADYALVEQAWSREDKGVRRPIGQVFFGRVETASVGYCLKYMFKPKSIGMRRNDDREPEFGTMSKGLGASYVKPSMIRWHNATDDRMYVNLFDGKRASMPRYYKQRIFDDQKRDLVGRLALQNMQNKIAREALAYPSMIEYEAEIKENVYAASRRFNRSAKLKGAL